MEFELDQKFYPNLTWEELNEHIIKKKADRTNLINDYIALNGKINALSEEIKNAESIFAKKDGGKKKKETKEKTIVCESERKKIIESYKKNGIKPTTKRFGYSETTIYKILRIEKIKLKN